MQFTFTMRRSLDGPDEPIPMPDRPPRRPREKREPPVAPSEMFRVKYLSDHKRAAYMRKWRATHPTYEREWRKTHPLTAEQKRRDNCRSYAKVYLKRGILTREPCLICDTDDAEMHHPDYAKPLNVVWLCRKHHLDLHKMGF